MQDIKKFIPHRPPFLFVDEIIAMTGDKIVAVKKIDPKEPFFEGHYPGNPIMPGVLLCEAIFQTGAALISNKMGGDDKPDGALLLARIKNAKFKTAVKPGDTIIIESSIIETLSNVYYMKGSIHVDGKTAVLVEFSVCIAKA